MASEIYKKHEPTIVFSPPIHLTNEFFEKSHTTSLVNAANMVLDTYHSLGAKKTPMEEKILFIIKNPGKVHSSESIAGIQKQKNGDAIYSVEVITEGKANKVDTQIFTLRVGKDSTEVSYVKNGELVELHCQQAGKGIIHEVNIA